MAELVFGPGAYEKDGEFFIDEAVLLNGIRPRSSTRTGEEELEWLKRNLKVVEAWVAKRTENNAMLRGVLGQKQKEIMEREERLTQEKTAGAVQEPHDSDGESAGTVEEVKKSDTEVRPFEIVSLLPLMIGSPLARNSKGQYWRQDCARVAEGFRATIRRSQR